MNLEKLKAAARALGSEKIIARLKWHIQQDNLLGDLESRLHHVRCATALRVAARLLTSGEPEQVERDRAYREKLDRFKSTVKQTEAASDVYGRWQRFEIGTSILCQP